MTACTGKLEGLFQIFNIYLKIYPYTLLLRSTSASKVCSYQVSLAEQKF